MKHLTVLVDMDDTLENLCEAWVSFLNEQYGLTVTTNDITDWDITKAFPTLTKKQVFAPLDDANMWERVKPLPKACETIRKLREEGHTVYVVTASNPKSVPIKLEKVLFKYFPFFTYHDVIITSRKQLIRGDVLVDDAPHNLDGGAYKRILMSAPHNRCFNEKDIQAVRAANWDAVYLLIKLLAHGKEWRYE